MTILDVQGVFLFKAYKHVKAFLSWHIKNMIIVKKFMNEISDNSPFYCYLYTASIFIFRSKFN